MLRALPLLVVPLAPVLSWLGAWPAAVFLVGAVAVAVLADWIRRATEQIAARTGPSIGGLLNVSLGSLAELVLAGFVLASGQLDIVRAQITGSIIATSLLGLGVAILAAGFRSGRQELDRENVGLLSTMLILVVITLMLPAVFEWTDLSRTSPERVRAAELALSHGAAGVLLLLYAGNLIYTLVTHRDVFSRGETQSPPEWGLLLSIGVMVVGTAAVAWEAELVSGAVEETASTLGLPATFLGVILLAVVGTASDIVAAIAFARRGQMTIVFTLCVGSAIQVALVVAPLLVLLAWAFGTPMTLVFNNPLDLFAIAGAAFIVRAIAADGATTWFEGLLLLGVYALLALAFFYVG